MPAEHQHDASRAAPPGDGAAQRTPLGHEHARLAALAGLDLLTGESLPEVLARVVAAAESLLPATLGASVVLWNAADESFTRAATTVPGQTDEGSHRRVRRSAGVSRWIVEHGRPLVVPDVESDDRFDHNPMVHEFGIRAYVGIPIVAASTPLGVLYALDDEVRHYAESDVAFLQTLARRASSAIVNSRLVEEIARARDRAQALAAVADALIAARSLREILTTVTGAVVDTVQADLATIQVIDLETRTVIHEIHEGAGDPPPADSYETLMAGPAGAAIRSGHTERGTTDDGGGSTMVVPLLFEGRPLGAVRATRLADAAGFGPDDVELLEAMAAQATVAIENARLHEATRAALRDVEALFELSRALNTTEDMGELLQNVVDGVARHLPADRVALFGLDLEQRRITHACKGGPGQDKIDLGVDLDELLSGLSGWALRHGRPAYSLSHTVDEREDAHVRRRREATDAGSVIVVPLTHRGRSFGTLTAINDASQRDFTPHEVDILASMGAQAAVAIVDAELFEQVQRLAVTDGLTGISNRGHLFSLAEREFVAARRYRRPLSAVMIDLDRFKDINDTHGHGVGDEVLVEVVRRCQGAIREADLFGRYGGDELLVLLPETPEPEAAQLAHRLRQRVSCEPVATAVGPIAVGISTGVAGVTPEDRSLQGLIDRADGALLAAKRAGRRPA